MLSSLLSYARRHHLGVVAVFFAMSGGAYAISGNEPRGVDWDGEIAGQQGATLEPQVLKPRFHSEPPEPTAEQRRVAEAQMRRSAQAWADRELPASDEAADEVVGPPPGSETRVPNTRASITVERNTTLSPASGFSSSTNEPAVSQNGKYVFYTGNWYAARSTDGGQTFSYIDPFADFTNFCCDQDTVYDPARNMHLWYRQGSVPSGGGTQNEVKLGVSTNGGATWCTYTLTPTLVNSTWTNRWFDYPRMTLTNDYVFITTNLFVTGGGFDRLVLLRLPLGNLRTCSSAGISHWSTQTGWNWSAVDGSTTTVYLGDTINPAAGTFRIYKIAESGSSLTFVDRTIPAWTATAGNGVCTISGGTNPCGKADQRIMTGWLRTGGTGVSELGFMWNVAQGGGFPMPYIEAAAFTLPAINYDTRPLIWNGSAAFQYPAAAPDARGSLGLTLTQFTSSSFPTQLIGIDDDLNAGAPPPWEIRTLNSSSAGPDANRWGDYARVRPFQPGGIGWVAANYTEQPGAQNGQPRYTVFGRGRDRPGIKRWWAQ